MLSKIFKFVQLALAGVVVVEGTLEQDTGASKQQKAINLINNEAEVAGAAFPGSQALTGSVVNIAVAGFNLAGLFAHKAPSVVIANKALGATS
jgi:hypothetical protein